VKKEVIGSRIEVQPIAGFDQALTYAISRELIKVVQVGSLVRIPLGKRNVLGLVSSLSSQEKLESSKLRHISSLVQQEPVLSKELLKLAKWMCRYYSCSMEVVLEAMIPAVVREGKSAKTERQLKVVSRIDSERIVKELNRSPKQKVLFLYLQKLGKPIAKREVMSRLVIGDQVVKGLVQKKFIEEFEEVVDRNAYEDEYDSDLDTVESVLKLTEEQDHAVRFCTKLLKEKKFSVNLLHGVTGSGKTEVYFRAMKEALNQGGSVLFLVPEISLAPQTVSRIRSRFGKQGETVVVWHSHLSAGERLDAWRNLATGKARIVVGARSAIFASMPNLRLIVVDEEHEPSYKQEDTPRYHGRDVAVYRAMLNQAVCLLGSATPSLETFRNVELKKYNQCVLTKRIDGRKLPLVHVVDMRREAQRERNIPILSQTLVEAIRQRYADREQSILFLNRRGFNTTMLCTECGNVERCKDCSIALTFHRTDGYLRCHLCGYRKTAPRVCSSCQSIEVHKKGHGTQRIEDVVSALMPRRAIVRRVDADLMMKKNLLRETLQDFRTGRIDVLVGTQMIAKGLDFPNVTLVGVIDADLPLRMEDFRASERAFQLLVQVAGRAGRGDRSGEVFIQSYAPHSSSIQFARNTDVYGFIEEEMEMRRELEYPPFRHLIRHIFRSRNEEKADFYANQWRKILDQEPMEDILIKGPAPAPLEKIKGYYRFHLIYLTSSVKNCLAQLEKKRESFPLDPQVQDILDVDAMQMN
tara:strand:- start:135 stop:2390 length:2256 start_codon:yes stop_codon:yes gene_type:complete